MILKVLPVICSYFLQKAKLANDVVREKVCIHFADIIQCRNIFGTLSNVVNNDNDLGIPLDRVKVTCHNIDAPFHKGTNNDNRMQQNRQSVNFFIIDLACMTFLDYEDIVTKNGGPKVLMHKIFFSC